MDKIGMLDLRILAPGVGNGNRVDEQMLAAALPGSGTGRILDHLASMVDRKLLSLGSDKSFRVTDAAVQILWSGAVPLRTRILHILCISPMTIQEAAGYLLEDEGAVGVEMDALRRDHAVIMSTARRAGRLCQIFEIQADADGNRQGMHDPDDSGAQARQLLSEIADLLGTLEIEPSVRAQLDEKIRRIGTVLGT